MEIFELFSLFSSDFYRAQGCPYVILITVEPPPTAGSPQPPPLYKGHFFGGQSLHWLLFKLFYNGHCYGEVELFSKYVAFTFSNIIIIINYYY